MTSPTRVCSTVSGEAQDRGLIDANVVIHLSALMDDVAGGGHVLSLEQRDCIAALRAARTVDDRPLDAYTLSEAAK